MSSGPGTKNSAEIIRAPDFVQPVVLASGVGQAFDTPAGMGFVSFAMNTDIFVRYGSTAAAAPSTSSTGSSGSEFNPGIRNISSAQACTGISLIAETSGKGSLQWYKPA
jgi:hypothetical protein